MNYDDLQSDIAEIFDESQALVSDARERGGWRLLGTGYVHLIPAAKTVERKPGGQSWRARPIVDQHGTLYRTLREAATRTRTSHVVIMAVLRGKRERAPSGFVFSYAEAK